MFRKLIFAIALVDRQILGIALPGIRADYTARVQARLEHQTQAQLEPQPTHQPSAGAQAPPQTLEDIRREARENWLKLRAGVIGAFSRSAITLTTCCRRRLTT